MRVCLLGTDFNSANRGCGALGFGLIEMLKKICEKNNEKLVVIALVWNPEPFPQIGNDVVSLNLIKIKIKKISFWKNCIYLFKESDFVIDFTGGDSFSDIYGKKRFLILTAIKQVAIWSKSPFVMGPQTIGPFESKIMQKIASHILKKTSICFVRDTMSYEYVKEISDVEPILTTDVAFALPYDKKDKKEQGKVKVGFNPSGLLWSNHSNFQGTKHICVDYQKYVKEIIKKLSQDPSIEIHLISHVFHEENLSGGNDLTVCKEIHKKFPNTIIASGYNTPMEAKSYISGMDVFIGARMHATIAAISSGVATIPFSYSRKFEGLYQDLDYPFLISGGKMSTEEAIERTISWIREFRDLEVKVRDIKKNIVEKQNIFYEEMKKFCENKE